MLELLAIKVAEIRVHELMLNWLPEDERAYLTQRRAVEEGRRTQQRVNAEQQRSTSSHAGVRDITRQLVRR